MSDKRVPSSEAVELLGGEIPLENQYVFCSNCGETYETEQYELARVWATERPEEPIEENEIYIIAIDVKCPNCEQLTNRGVHKTIKTE